MCTVSLTFGEKGFTLSSNRDEAPGRETLAPAIYVENGLRLLYPKDAEAGGTWLGVGENRRAICLLNGGFENHERKPPYRLSRGIVVKDMLKVADFAEGIRNYDLNNVEPFTMIIIEWKNDLLAAEVVWDGDEKHLQFLPKEPHFWSSSPLYSTKARKEREAWFQKFLQEKEPVPENLLEFHLSAGKGHKQNGVIMDRGFVKTRSVSQVILSGEKILFYYKDLETGEETEVNFEI